MIYHMTQNDYCKQQSRHGRRVKNLEKKPEQLFTHAYICNDLYLSRFILWSSFYFKI